VAPGAFINTRPRGPVVAFALSISHSGMSAGSPNKVAKRGSGGAGGGGDEDAMGAWQGLTLVHFSAQLEPCLTQGNNLHTLNTPKHPLNTDCTTPTRIPYPIQSAQVELKSGRV